MKKKLHSNCLYFSQKHAHLFKFFNNSDSELIKQAERGNENAFKQLVIRHEQHVRATVSGMLGYSPQAEDVAQEVFIRFFRNLSEFRGEASLKTYLTRISINLSLNEIKRSKRQRQTIRLLNENEELPKHADQMPVEDNNQKERIHLALQKLDAEAKTIIVLRMLNGFSVKETAKILDLPQGTVASRFSRSLKKLKEIMEDNV